MDKTKLALLYARLYAATHRMKKRILFISYSGLQYSDSPRVICEKMHELYPEYELVWAFLQPEEKHVPEYVKKISCRGTEYYKHLATSCAFVTNEDLHEGIFKRKGQYFVQTWHGDRPLKKVLYEIEGGIPYEIVDNKFTDLCVAGSDHGYRMYRNAFRYGGNILSEGMPRNDALIEVDKKKITEIRKKLGIKKKQRVLLYAPTFRDNKMTSHEKQNITVDLQRVMRRLERNGEWACLMRVHTGVNGFNFEFNCDSYIDVTEYEEITDLYLISDCLITDYSTCATDYILLKRPTILAVFDLKEYEATCRNLIDGFMETGFLMAHTQDELDEIMDHFDEIDGEQEYEAVRKFFGIHEMGNSAEKICKIMKENIFEK